MRGTLTLEEAAVQAVSAGCDMLLVEEPQAAERVQAALSAALGVRETSERSLEQALQRIQLVKRCLRPPSISCRAARWKTL